MNNKEFTVLLNFLKSGLSTWNMDRLLGYSDTRGWMSWAILKKYYLQDYDKGKLFLYSTRQSKEIILKLVEKKQKGLIDLLIKDNYPKNLEKYRNTLVAAESERKFYSIFSGETRNIIRDFFNPKKKLVGKCQYKNCKRKNAEIDTVHYLKDRPEIFIKCASKYRNRYGKNMLQFDVYRTMKCFLKSHSKSRSVCFLCKKHHNEFHQTEKLGKTKLRDFKKKIIY